MERQRYSEDADAAELQKVNWHLPKEFETENDYLEISGIMFKLSQSENINKILSSTLKLLGHICGMMLEPSNIEEPFKPISVINGENSYDLLDINEKHIDVIKEFLTRTNSMAIKARLYDLLWFKEKPKNVDMGKNAIVMYLALSENIRKCTRDDLLYCENFLLRALTIATQINDDSLLQKINLESKESMFLEEPEPGNHLRLKFMRIFSLGLDQEKADYWLDFINKLVTESERNGDYRKARDYIDIQINLTARLKKIQKREEFEKNKTLIFIREARRRKDQGANAMTLQSLFTQAIQSCRATKGMSGFAEELINELKQTQKNIINEMKEISVPVDTSASEKAICQKIERLSALEATELVLSCAFPDKKNELIYNAVEISKEFPLQSIFGMSFIDSKGKVIAKQLGRPSSNNPEELEKHNLEQACNYLRNSLNYKAHMIQIGLRHLKRHHDAEAVFQELIEKNTFIPTEQIHQFKRGILAGLSEDWITAGYILVPLLENAFRIILEQNGYAVTKVSHEGIQEEVDMNQFLPKEKFKEIFGEDWQFHLHVILTRKDGLNLRNQIAHGLLTDGSAFGPGMIIIWANVCHLCLITKYKLIEKNNKCAQQI